MEKLDSSQIQKLAANVKVKSKSSLTKILFSNRDLQGYFMRILKLLIYLKYKLKPLKCLVYTVQTIVCTVQGIVHYLLHCALFK